MGDMVPRRRRLVCGYRVPPLIPWQKPQLRALPEMREHRLRVRAQSERSWRDHMETFTDRIIGVSERELECLRDIVRVHMVHSLHPVVRELQQLAVSNLGEHVRIEMPGRIQRVPPRTHHVPWMQ